MDPIDEDVLLYGDEYEPEIDYDEVEPSREPPTDVGLADWHLRKLLAFKAKAKADDEVFAEALERMKARRSAVAARHRRAIDYHGAAVEAWHRQEVRLGRADKTLRLPSGVSKLIAAKVDLTVADEEELRTFLSGQVTEDGESWEKLVFEPQADMFRVMALRKLVKPPKDKGKLEPGTPVELRTSAEQVAKGVRAVVQPDNWSASAATS